MSRMYHASYKNRDDAERALRDLRDNGIHDDHISIVGNKDHVDVDDDIAGHDVDTSEAVADVVGKTAAGAGVGALLGVAAMAIPGVGPLVAAGAVAQAAAGGAALTGTAVGAAAGGLAGLLTDHGVDEDDAAYYEDRVNDGELFMSVDGTNYADNDYDIDDAMYRNNGISAARARELS